MAKPKSARGKKTASSPGGRTAFGRWTRLPAGDENASSGGGRLSVSTEVMAVPGGWVMRTLVTSSEGMAGVALCYLPKR